MKELERYIGAADIDSCQPAIMTETLATFPDQEMPSTIPVSGIESTKIDAEMTYLEKKNIDESMQQNLMKKDVYKSDMHNIYNIILGQTNEK